MRNKDWYNCYQTAERLKISKNKVRTFCRKGVFSEAYKKSGVWYIPLSSIEQYETIIYKKDFVGLRTSKEHFKSFIEKLIIPVIVGTIGIIIGYYFSNTVSKKDEKQNISKMIETADKSFDLANNAVCNMSLYEDTYKAYSEIHNKYFTRKFPVYYFKIESKLGFCLLKIGSQQKSENKIWNSISHFENSLKTKIDTNSISYGLSLFGRCKAYISISEIRNTGNYLEKAQIDLENAFLIINKNTHPSEYASLTLAQAHIFSIQAELKDKEEFSLKALSLLLPLKMLIKKDNNTEIAHLYNSLGVNYKHLSEVNNTDLYLNSAIVAYNNSLSYSNPQLCAYDYALTKFNLGHALRALSEVKKDTSLIELSIQTYNEALEVFTIESYPKDYADTHGHLGNSYNTHFFITSTVSSLDSAISNYQKALNILTLDKYPLDYALTQMNLGNSYNYLSRKTNKGENLRKAILAYEKALVIRNFYLYSYEYANTQYNLGNAYFGLVIENGEEIYNTLAVKAFEEAIKTFTEKDYPYLNKDIKDFLQFLKFNK